ncbi:hypothetical protein [Paenibacillus sp. 1P07SE]|uniref:hypothetical protein n=1 Tax=Paenibacillus sp. 1P07SE TaxID=3132209 RepID=UPI0039A5C2AE
MNPWIRKIGAGGLGAMLALTLAAGTGLASYDEELEDIQEAASQMDVRSQQQMIGGLSDFAVIDLSSMDIETALMMVQQQRTQLLDQQLQSQMDAVQARNTQLAALNEQLNQAQTQGNTDEVNRLKNQIDALTNTMQMDMLRLQSLSNKRNEAFETMTNFIKKMQDSRSTIIGNMR